MDKQLQNLMGIYKEAERDYKLDTGRTFTEHLTERIKKSTDGYKDAGRVIKDYEASCSAYLKAKFIEFNTSVAAVLISLLACVLSIVSLQEKVQIQKIPLTMGMAAVLILFLVIVIGIVDIRLKQKEIKIRKILFAVQKIEEELEEKEQNKENDIEIEKKTKKDK